MIKFHGKYKYNKAIYICNDENNFDIKENIKKGRS